MTSCVLLLHDGTADWLRLSKANVSSRIFHMGLNAVRERVLFIQEYGKDGWEVVYQMDDQYHDQECDDPNCDCHHSNMIALEEDE